MSRRRVVPALILLPLLALACCRSAGGQAGPWSQKISYGNKGTKSESQSVSLLYEGKALPDVFDEVVAAGVHYAFKTRPYLWGESGYLRSVSVDERIRARIDAAMTVLVDEPGLSAAEKAAGFYLGTQRRPGTPDAWFWARRDDLSAFIDPKKVDAFLAAHPLSPLPQMALEVLLPAK